MENMLGTGINYSILMKREEELTTTGKEVFCLKYKIQTFVFLTTDKGSSQPYNQNQSKCEFVNSLPLNTSTTHYFCKGSENILEAGPEIL